MMLATALDCASPTTVCYPFVGREIGGSHISALGLIRNLDRKRFKPLVVLQHPDSPIGDLFRGNGLDIAQAPASGEFGHGELIGVRQVARTLCDLIPLTRFLRSNRVEILHSNDGRSHVTWALPARMAGAKFFWHHRGDRLSSGLRFGAPLLAHQVVAVSHFAAPRPGLLSALHKTRVVYSPFQVDTAEDRDTERRTLIDELGCAPETRVIGFFGSFIGRKRPLLFVEAIADLRRRLPTTPIIGLLFGVGPEGYDATIMAHAAKLGIAQSIVLMGFRSPGTRWLAACDILLVSAIDEPFGRTLIEAMLVGTPVVATASGGNSEAIRHGTTGLLVRPEDAEALGSAVRVLLDTPELYRSIALAARREAQEKYGEEQHAREIMKLYDKILPRRKLRKAPYTRFSPRVQLGGTPNQNKITATNQTISGRT